MPTIKLEYGSPTVVPITLTGLASGSAQQSDAIDNTSNLFEDIIVQMTIQYSNNPGDGSIFPYYSASLDGVNFDGSGVTGVDNPYTGNFNDFYGVYQGHISPIQNETSSRTFNIVWNPGAVSPYFSFVISNTSSFSIVDGSLTIVGVGLQSG